MPLLDIAPGDVCVVCGRCTCTCWRCTCSPLTYHCWAWPRGMWSVPKPTCLLLSSCWRIMLTGLMLPRWDWPPCQPSGILHESLRDLKNLRKAMGFLLISPNFYTRCCECVWPAAVTQLFVKLSGLGRPILMTLSWQSRIVWKINHQFLHAQQTSDQYNWSAYMQSWDCDFLYHLVPVVLPLLHRCRPFPSRPCWTLIVDTSLRTPNPLFRLRVFPQWLSGISRLWRTQSCRFSVGVSYS